MPHSSQKIVKLLAGVLPTIVGLQTFQASTYLLLHLSFLHLEFGEDFRFLLHEVDLYLSQKIIYEGQEVSHPISD